MTITRFAPSPNGPLHAGHAFSALFSEQLAKRRGGRFLLRIEDLDTTRAREEHVRAIYDDLRWLGVSWQPPVRRQSEHMADYSALLEKLKRMGLLYPCFCTRGDIRRAVAENPRWPRDPDGAPIYPGTCRGMSHEQRNRRMAGGERPAWRLDMARALEMLEMMERPLTWREEGAGPGGETGIVTARPRDWGDVVLGRRDIGASYHLAVVHDDALQGVTHVTRGQDLFHATAIHRLLQELLALPQPAYVHHRLITTGEGRKLSKSLRDQSLADLRAAGMTARQLRQQLGF